MSRGIAVRGAHLLSSAATTLLRQVQHDPSAPLSVAVCGAAGYGKTALLKSLAASYNEAGMPVGVPWQTTEGGEHSVLLVDDAHLLDEQRLCQVAEHAGKPGARTVVAFRPWPGRASQIFASDLANLHHCTLSLPPLTGQQIRDHVSEAYDTPVSQVWTDYLLSETGGVPRYLDRLIAGFGGFSAAVMAEAPPQEPPAAALASFAADLHELDTDLLIVLLAVEAGAGLSAEFVADLLGRQTTEAAGIVAAAKATGMLTGNGALIPIACRALAVHAPAVHRIDVRQRLAAWQLARGGPVLGLVRPLLEFLPDAGPDTVNSPAMPLVSRTDGVGLGHVLLAAAEESLRDDPAVAAQLFAAAARTGTPAPTRWALANALAGDLDAASLLADQALTDGPADQRQEAAYVAATTLVHRNQLARAVDMYRWADPRTATAFGAIALIAVGKLHAADELLRTESADQPAAAGPPTLLGTAARGMAGGIRDSITGSPVAAVSALVQAGYLLEPAETGVLLPDSPAAMAGLLAVHCAEFATAKTALDRAVRNTTGGPVLVRRHRLLLAWTLMVEGSLAAAAEQAALAGVYDHPPAALQGRDVLFATALRLGLARRSSDLVALRTAWPAAGQALIGQPIDLFTLLPLGEIAIAAARLGEQRQVEPALATADAVLDRLDDPPLWSVPLHWSRLHAAILADDLPAAERHALAMRAGKGHSRYATVVSNAADCWLEMLCERIEPGSVETAARAMADLGLPWDGARLAGQAAIRTTDRKAMTTLLECARSLQTVQPGGGDSGAPARRGGRPRDPERQILTDREHDVAALVLAGLTYRQVASRLYISAKTVEHHMARIKQRLGCTDRRELMARLHELTGADGRPA